MNNISEETKLRLWLNNIEGIGLKTIKILLAYFNNCILDIYNQSFESLEKIVGKNKAEKISGNHNIYAVENKIKQYKERNVNIIFPGHPDYPEKLLNIYDYPEILYVRGNINDNVARHNKNIAIVGARNPDIYGKEMAAYFAKELSNNGINIISGLARGIDGCSHIGALENNGYTIAVLGCGINVTYPREHVELFSEIEKQGAVISEYGFDVPPNQGQFPMRNRIISGLSDGVFVVEAQKKSGSLITVNYALEQGKQIYALPGRAYDLLSQGCNELIKSGAICVTKPEDILFDLNIAFNKEINCDSDTYNDNDKNLLAPNEKKVYSCLSLEPKYIDDIIKITKMGIVDTINSLYLLEDKKLIKQPIQGYYIKTIM